MDTVGFFENVVKVKILLQTQKMIEIVESKIYHKNAFKIFFHF